MENSQISCSSIIGGGTPCAIGGTVQVSRERATTSSMPTNLAALGTTTTHLANLHVGAHEGLAPSEMATTPQQSGVDLSMADVDDNTAEARLESAMSTNVPEVNTAFPIVHDIESAQRISTTSTMTTTAQQDGVALPLAGLPTASAPEVNATFPDANAYDNTTRTKTNTSTTISSPRAALPANCTPDHIAGVFSTVSAVSAVANVTEANTTLPIRTDSHVNIIPTQPANYFILRIDVGTRMCMYDYLLLSPTRHITLQRIPPKPIYTGGVFGFYQSHRTNSQKRGLCATTRFKIQPHNPQVDWHEYPKEEQMFLAILQICGQIYDETKGFWENHTFCFTANLWVSGGQNLDSLERAEIELTLLGHLHTDFASVIFELFSTCKKLKSATIRNNSHFDKTRDKLWWKGGKWLDDIAYKFSEVAESEQGTIAIFSLYVADDGPLSTVERKMIFDISSLVFTCQKQWWNRQNRQGHAHGQHYLNRWLSILHYEWGGEFWVNNTMVKRDRKPLNRVLVNIGQTWDKGEGPYRQCSSVSIDFMPVVDEAAEEEHPSPFLHHPIQTPKEITRQEQLATERKAIVKEERKRKKRRFFKRMRS
ncbi:uncharacterized protein PAC_02862 [Phialocephala subalpina]|uniref:Uncharacterized protein n=1 Tax=Phialocephala subalpina TaxID=576137 RepID=A0A1L7WJM8_9HELO|nr:uncharacterized protein PAC_02862 [Phialocephala subalpina]